MTDKQRYEQSSDASLVRQILSGDEKAFATLYKRHKKLLRRFIFNKIGDWDDAEELTDDTFLKAKAHLKTLREPEKVLNWMFRIAYQLAMGWHRKNRKPDAMQSSIDVYEVEGEAEATAVVHQIAQAYVTTTERWTALLEAIEQLPELEQKMIHLQLENKSYEEIAEICRVSVGSVRNRLSRAKRKLETWAAAWEEANAEGGDLDFSEFFDT